MLFLIIEINTRVSVINRHAFNFTDMKLGINLERIIADTHIIVRYRK